MDSRTRSRPVRSIIAGRSGNRNGIQTIIATTIVWKSAEQSTPCLGTTVGSSANAGVFNLICDTAGDAIGNRTPRSSVNGNLLLQQFWTQYLVCDGRVQDHVDARSTAQSNRVGYEIAERESAGAGVSRQGQSRRVISAVVKVHESREQELTASTPGGIHRSGAALEKQEAAV